MDRELIWSWGGGVQTIGILCLIAEGKLPKPKMAIMADTGREKQSTWDYHHEYAQPLLDDLRIPFILASHDLATVDLYAKNGDLLLPAFTSSGGKLSTFCSNEWKKYVARRKLRELGYGPSNPILLWFGMSLDEVHRLKVSDVKWIKNHYPLCFDTKKRRNDCLVVINDFGLPPPPKSSCYMCPNINDAEWRMMKEDTPLDFIKAVELEAEISKKDTRGGVYLHSSRMPLDKVTFDDEAAPPPILGECASVCWT